MNIKTNVVLKPVFNGTEILYVEVSVQAAGTETKKGTELMHENLSTVTIAGCPMTDLTVTDEAGEVPYTAYEDQPYPYILRHYTAERDVQGTLNIQYKAFPYPWTEKEKVSRHGPYFDFRPENGGGAIVGHAFLPQISGVNGDTALDWDLSASPEGARGISPWGDGKIELEGSYEQLRNGYYMFGLIHCEEEGDFGFYWIDETTFDMRAIALFTKDLFRRMQVFFHDKQSRYRVFARHDGTVSSGGTAMVRSYMFGWNDHEPVSVEEKQNLLAHEMTHNWPHLQDNPYGISTWYAEGTAEYYSVMLPLRFGLCTKETALKELQERSDSYYSNPTRGMSNMEAVKICWQDRRAQKIPYGRGIFYLANVGAMISRATNGEKDIDDVVLALLDKDWHSFKDGYQGNEVFLQTVKEISGLDIRKMHEDMAAGVPFDPDPDSFGGMFRIEEKVMKEAGSDKDVKGYTWSLREE